MRVPPLSIPALVATALVAGYVSRTTFTQPTSRVDYEPGPGQEAVFVVDGLRCKGTAMYLTSFYEDVPGIRSIVTYASERKAVFTYDPAQLSPDRIRAVMEAPIPMDDGTSRQVFKCVSAK
jgi:hypothetical protein